MSDYRQNFCPHCGSKLTEGANVCSVCGATIEAPQGTYGTPTPTTTYQQPSYQRPTYQQPTTYIGRSDDEGLDATQAIVLCCVGSPATAWVVFKSLGMEKKAYHSCIIFFLPMIGMFLFWIVILFPLLALLMSGIDGYYPY